MSMQQFIQSKYFRWVAIAAGVFLVALLSFAVGVKVGFHKAKFSADWGRNFERQFLGEQGGKEGPGFAGLLRMKDKGMRNGHGLAGEILSIADSTIMIRDRANQENTIRLNESTIINQGSTSLTPSDLAVGQKIVVIGRPDDDGVVAARLIRVFDVSQ